MQYRKDEIRDKILCQSKTEFLEHGFKGSSLRRIASKAGITTGGIYTYFASKEDIFTCLVEGVLHKWSSRPAFSLLFSGLNIKSYIKDLNKDDLDSREFNYQYLVKFINIYREELNLLFFSSSGTKYESFEEQLVSRFLHNAKKELHSDPLFQLDNISFISDFFLRNIVLFNINLIKEMLMNELEINDMMVYEREISSFFYFGWRSILLKQQQPPHGGC